MSMTKQETNSLDEKEKQKQYNHKWLAKLTPEERKTYFRQNMRKTRGWKCADCGNLEPTIKTLDTKKKLCDACYIQLLKQKIVK